VPIWQRTALIDNDYKIVVEEIGSDQYKLFDLVKDKKEEKDLFAERPELAQKMRQAVDAMIATVAQSRKGADCPEGKVTKRSRSGKGWGSVEAHKLHLELLATRPGLRETAQKGMRKNKRCFHYGTW